jgi:hypothetical protein
VGRKGKSKYSTSPNRVQQRDMYDVKENLNKLKSGSGNERYETNIDVSNNKTTDPYYSNNQPDDFSNYSTNSTAHRLDKINDKLTSDFSGLKDAFIDHKDLVIDRLNTKVDKDEFKYWIGGIITAIIILAGLIYTLSYSGVISDIKDLNRSNNSIERRVDKIEYKLEHIESEKPVNANKK